MYIHDVTNRIIDSNGLNFSIFLSSASEIFLFFSNSSASLIPAILSVK